MFFSYMAIVDGAQTATSNLIGAMTFDDTSYVLNFIVLLYIEAENYRYSVLGL